MADKQFKVACLTGAGISAESGIATFRGMGGLWENHPIEAVATPQGFAKDPNLVWQFYEARRKQALSCEPNKGHFGLAQLQQNLGEKNFCLTTQNVDGLHQKAGVKNVLELHGSLWRVRCTKCLKEREEFKLFESVPPKCECGAMLRPSIVWFGEMLPPDIFESAGRAAEKCDLYLVIGTSGVVEPAASLARVAGNHGAKVWEINPEETALTHICERSWRSGAGAVIEEVIEEVLKLKKAI
jgi:NAD-dependent deacetylase